MRLVLLSLLPLLAEASDGPVRVFACHGAQGDLRLSNHACQPGREVAAASFINTINSTGWSQLEVTGSGGNWSDAMVAYAAGAVEGRATADLIYWHWLNTVAGYCEGVEEYCQRLETFLARNWAWMQGQIAARPSDPYWHQVNLILNQLAGMVDGYYQSVKTPHSSIDVSGFLMFQLSGDLEDIEQALKKPSWKLRKVTGSGSCSALIKVLPGNKDLFMAHDTWSTYQSMLRVLKLYKLSFRLHDHSSPLPISLGGVDGGS